MTDTPHARFGAHVKTRRKQQQRTQAEVGHHLHVTADAVRKWESGRSLPDPDAARLLDAYLNAGGVLHADYLRSAANRTENRTGTGQGLSAASVLADSAQQVAEFGTWAEATNVGEVAITALRNRVQELLQRALTEPPATVARDAAALNAHVFDLLRGHHRPAHARALYTTAGAACALLTWLAGDLGAIDVAQVHAATAAMCAEMSEDPETTAWVAVSRSKTAFWAGNYGEAARLAHYGRLQPAPGTAAVMLACQEADAHSKLGDAERTEQALQAALRAADATAGPDGFGGLFSCAAGRAANYASAAHQAVGSSARALIEADGALEAFATGGAVGFGTVAQVHITKALAYVDTGDIDAAAAAARPVLDLPDQRRLRTLTGRLALLGRPLGAAGLRDSRVAGPLLEEIREFCTPGRRALPAGTGSEKP